MALRRRRTIVIRHDPLVEKALKELEEIAMSLDEDIDSISTVVAASTEPASLTVTTIYADYTATTTDDWILADCTAGDITVTLPSAIDNSGKVYYFSKIDTSSNTLTVEGYIIETEGDHWSLGSDGTTWR